MTRPPERPASAVSQQQFLNNETRFNGFATFSASRPALSAILCDEAMIRTVGAVLIFSPTPPPTCTRMADQT